MKIRLDYQRFVTVEKPAVCNDNLRHIGGLCYLPEKIKNELFVLWLAYSCFFSNSISTEYERKVKEYLGLFKYL